MLHRNERAAAAGRLHNYNCLAERREHTISAGEVVRQRRRPREELGHYEPPRHDVPEESPMRRRIGSVGTSPEHGNGPTAGVERAHVRAAVDAERHSAHDRVARTRDRRRQPSSEVASPSGRLPCPDDRDARGRQKLGPTAQKEYGRWVGEVAQHPRILCVRPRQCGCVQSLGIVQPGRDPVSNLGVAPRDGGTLSGDH